MNVPREKLSIEGFLVWEEGQAERQYLWRDVVFAMAGARQSHAIAAGNVSVGLV